MINIGTIGACLPLCVEVKYYPPTP